MTTEAISEGEQEAAQYLTRVMANARGDDLERCQAAFGKLTDDELGEQHGQSGRTKRQVWQGYKDHRALWEAAKKLLDKVLKEQEVTHEAP